MFTLFLKGMINIKFIMNIFNIIPNIFLLSNVIQVIKIKFTRSLSNPPRPSLITLKTTKIMKEKTNLGQ